jgi:hypothetical protein
MARPYSKGGEYGTPTLTGQVGSIALETTRSLAKYIRGQQWIIDDNG